MGVTLPPGTRLGPYEVTSLLGAGGMGEVYRAKDTRLGRTVAIKILPPEFASDPERKRRFEQEARAVSALNHPNIGALYDVGSAAVPQHTPRAVTVAPPLDVTFPPPTAVKAVIAVSGSVVVTVGGMLEVVKVRSSPSASKEAPNVTTVSWAVPERSVIERTGAVSFASGGGGP